MLVWELKPNRECRLRKVVRLRQRETLKIKKEYDIASVCLIQRLERGTQSMSGLALVELRKGSKSVFFKNTIVSVSTCSSQG